MSNTQKMNEARRKKRDEEIWESVSNVIQRERCNCKLRKGMTRDQLPDFSCKEPEYICPALDMYRRMLPPVPLPEKEFLMQEPWKMIEDKKEENA